MSEKELKQELQRMKENLAATQTAILDVLNYSNMFVLVLDEKMNIKFINWSLATALGFENEFEPLDRCWLDFIPKEIQETIKTVHASISRGGNPIKFREFTNEVLKVNGEKISIKWFNTAINHDYNWSFSIGLLNEAHIHVTEESIRSYYQNVIQNDRTMILSLRDTILEGVAKVDSCEPNSLK